MALLETIHIEDGLLLIWEMTESLDSLKSMADEALTDPLFQKLTNPKRQKEWLAVRLLLQLIDCKSNQLDYTESGQPVLNHSKYRHISISHSDRLAGIFLHATKTVGLDIENADRDFRRIETKYLAPEEKQLALTIRNGHGLFWCIKEAVYKAAGIPGIHFSEQIRIELAKPDNFTAQLIANKKMTFNIHHFELGRQLIVCLIDEKGNTL